MTIKTLADFKRQLRQPGATITLVEMPHAYNAHAAEYFKTVIGVPRAVVRVQGDAFTVRQADGGESWIYFHKAGQWSFDGDVAIKQTDNGVTPMKLRLTVTQL